MKKALVVALNDYPGTGSDLQGCINDALDGLAALKAKGFTCSSISNAGAKKATILAALKSLIACARSGDSLVFYYSAHGSQVRDSSSDESDGWDEVLCPYDWPQYVSDDDIRSILSKVPTGVNIDVIMDCCHSGTGTREIGQTYTVRALPPIVGKVSKKDRAAVILPTLNHCLWAACKDGQTSAELLINGKVRGAFSYYLWKEIRAGGTRSAIMARVCKQVAALGLKQVPQLEANQAEMLQAPFA